MTTGDDPTEQSVLATARCRLEHDREAYLDECLTEVVRAGSYVAVAVAVVTLFWLVGAPIGSPAATFGTPATLAILAALGFSWLKPIIRDASDLNRYVDPQWRARSLVAVGLIVAMLGFGATATAGSAGFEGLTDIASGLLKFGIVGLAVVVPAVFLVSWPVVYAGIMGTGAGVVSGIFMGGREAATTNAFVVTTIVLLVVSAGLIDRRLVDRGAVLAAVGVGLLLFGTVTDPAVTIPATVAAAVFASGFRFESGYEPYPRSSSIVGSLPDRAGSATIEAGKAGEDTVELSAGTRVRGILFAARKRAHKLSRWRLLLVMLMVVLAIPLLLVPGLLVASYLLRLTASAAAGEPDPPTFTMFGRRSAMKEGLIGILFVLPFAGVATWLTPPILAALPTLGNGESALHPVDVAAAMTRVFAEVGVPAAPVTDPLLATLAIVGILALLPVPLVSYATGGRLRDGLDPTRYQRVLVNRRYPWVLAVQMVLLLIPVGVLSITIGLALGFLFGGGVVVGALLLYVGPLVALYLFTRVLVTSAVVWGYYWQQATATQMDPE